MIYEMQSASAADTDSLGRRLGQSLLQRHSEWPLVLELIGDLGSGKTTFVKGLAVGLGYHGEVTSPTFTVNQTYELGNDLRLEHFDLYRLDELGVMEPELAEVMSDPTAVTAIEWPQQASSFLPTDRLIINFVATHELGRQLKLDATGELSTRLLSQMKGDHK